MPTSYERSFYSSSQNTESEKVRDLNEIFKRLFSTSTFLILSFPGQILRLGMKQFEGCEWPLFEFKKNNFIEMDLCCGSSRQRVYVPKNTCVAFAVS